MESSLSKEYLGDGVYIDFHNNMLCLTVEDGTKIKAVIWLEKTVYNRLVKYRERLGDNF